MPPDTPDGSWHEWGRYVLEALKTREAAQFQHEKDAREEYKSLREEIQELRALLATTHSDIAVVKAELRIKAGVWGLMAGGIPAIIALVVQFLK